MTYSVAEFSSGAWQERTDELSWCDVMTAHSACQNLGKCGDTDVWFFLNDTETSFEYWTYHVHSWGRDGAPSACEPFMWIYGTKFDGIRECSGGQGFSIGLVEQSNALRWLHTNACARWPRFSEWYDDEPRAKRGRVRQ